MGIAAVVGCSFAIAGALVLAALLPRRAAVILAVTTALVAISVTALIFGFFALYPGG